MACLATCCTRPAPCGSSHSSSPPRPAQHETLAPTVDPSGDWDVRWDRGFSGWKPTIFDGTLSIEREGARWVAHLSFGATGSPPSFESLRMDGNQIDILFGVPAANDGSGHDAGSLRQLSPVRLVNAAAHGA